MKTIENALVASTHVPKAINCESEIRMTLVNQTEHTDIVGYVVTPAQAAKAHVAGPSTIDKWLGLGGLTNAEAASLIAAGFKPKPRSNIGEWSKVFDAKDRDRKVDIFKLGQLFIASSRNTPGFRGRDIVSSDDLEAVIAAVNAEFSPASALVR